jgi:hypothetical protein
MAIARDTVAYHEAGHAVAAKVLGLTIDRISINPEGDAAGHGIHDYDCNMNEVIYEDGPDRQWALERAALVAGIVRSMALRQPRGRSFDRLRPLPLPATHNAMP